MRNQQLINAFKKNTRRRFEECAHYNQHVILVSWKKCRHRHRDRHRHRLGLDIHGGGAGRYVPRPRFGHVQDAVVVLAFHENEREHEVLGCLRRPGRGAPSTRPGREPWAAPF